MQTASIETKTDINETLRKLEGRLRQLATRFSHSGASVDDLVQEGRIALWQATKTWRTDGGASLWTYARRTVFEVMLRCATAHIAEAHESFDDVCERVGVETSVEVDLTVHECLALLTEREKSVVKSFLEGLSFAAIANDMKCSDQQVHRIFKSAVETLREKVAA